MKMKRSEILKDSEIRVKEKVLKKFDIGHYGKFIRYRLLLNWVV